MRAWSEVKRCSAIWPAESLQAIVSMLVVSMVAFVLARLTGDPLEIMMPAEATQEDIAMMRAYLGLDRPWPVQYWRFISRAVQGDFGRSVRFNRPALAVSLSAIRRRWSSVVWLS